MVESSGGLKVSLVSTLFRTFFNLQEANKAIMPVHGDYLRSVSRLLRDSPSYTTSFSLLTNQVVGLFCPKIYCFQGGMTVPRSSGLFVTKKTLRIINDLATKGISGTDYSPEQLQEAFCHLRALACAVHSQNQNSQPHRSQCHNSGSRAGQSRRPRFPR